ARRLRQKRNALGDDRREFDRALTGHRAEPHLPVALLYIRERRDAVEIDERRRPTQAEVEQRHQALAAGQDLRYAVLTREQRERFVHRLRRVIVELRGFHATLIDSRHRSFLPSWSRAESQVSGIRHTCPATLGDVTRGEP